MRQRLFFILFLALIPLACDKQPSPEIGPKDIESPKDISEKPPTEPEKEILFCDKSNFTEYVYDTEKTTRLIAETGQGCQLQGFVFEENTILNNLDFRFADLTDATLVNIFAVKINFKGAIFIEANLQNSVFKLSNFKGADFKGADLRGTSFETSNIDNANFLHIKYDNNSRFFEKPVIVDPLFNPKP